MLPSCRIFLMINLRRSVVQDLGSMGRGKCEDKWEAVQSRYKEVTTETEERYIGLKVRDDMGLLETYDGVPPLLEW